MHFTCTVNEDMEKKNPSLKRTNQIQSELLPFREHGGAQRRNEIQQSRDGCSTTSGGPGLNSSGLWDTYNEPESIRDHNLTLDSSRNPPLILLPITPPAR